MESHLQVQWKHHQEGVLKFLEELQATETFVDVTLCCGGCRLKAHRVVLSAYSPYLQQVLVENPGEHATIILHDIGAEEMRSLLRFMYSGSASLPRRSLKAFLRAAHALQVSVLMPGAEHALSEELLRCSQTTRATEPPLPTGSRSSIPDVPHDLSTTSSVKAELDLTTRGRMDCKKRRHYPEDVPVRSSDVAAASSYQGEEAWGHAFRESLMGTSTVSSRQSVIPTRPTPVVKSPWSQAIGGGTPWATSPVIAPIQPPTPPAAVPPHVTPTVCQSSGGDSLTVPGLSPEVGKPYNCPPSPFCPSPSSPAYPSSCSWLPYSPSPSPRPPTLLSVPMQDHSTDLPAKEAGSMSLSVPNIRAISPNPVSTNPSPPSSPSRFTLKQRRLRDFYRSMQGTNSADDSQSSDRQLGIPSVDSGKDDETQTAFPSSSQIPSPSKQQWPGSASPLTGSHSVIKLSKRSAFQPPTIVVSPPEISTPDDASQEKMQQPSTSPAPPSLLSPVPSSSGGPPSTGSKSPSGSGAHTCETCGKSFGRRQLLEQHRRTHTGEKPFSCAVCGKSFTQRGHWSVHQRLHDGSRPHACPVCGKAFVSRASLKVHHRTHTGEKPFRCDDCGKQFSQLRNFKYHRSVHEGTREFACTCPECGKQFNDRGYLSSHLKIHRNRKEYACEHCEKRFNQRVAYNMHVRIHTGEKPHVCTECGKRFGRKMLLRQHARTHTGERPFRCAICNKAFADRSNMALHARLHSGEKPHSCHLCGKAFTKKHHLKTHMNFHSGLKPYSCPKCGLRFSQSSNMRTHTKKCTAQAVDSEPGASGATGGPSGASLEGTPAPSPSQSLSPFGPHTHSPATVAGSVGDDSQSNSAMLDFEGSMHGTEEPLVAGSRETFMSAIQQHQTNSPPLTQI